MSGEHRGTAAESCGANAAPYVLGALPEAEYRAFVVHLDSCAVCREEVAALQIAADALPVAAPQLQAPTSLKDEIMASVREDALRDAGVELRPRRSRGLVSLVGRPAFALAGAGAIIAVVAVLALAGGGGGGVRIVRAEVSAPRASASVRLDAGHAELRIAGMPQTSADRVYEVWVQRGGALQPTNALFTVTRGGSATVGVPGDVTGAKAIMVTSEPLGGSRVPTRAPVIVAKLS
jgi:hypothetical protein